MEHKRLDEFAPGDLVELPSVPGRCYQVLNVGGHTVRVRAYAPEHGDTAFVPGYLSARDPAPNKAG